jgi:hypothetical protein
VTICRQIFTFFRKSIGIGATSRPAEGKRPVQPCRLISRMRPRARYCRRASNAMLTIESGIVEACFFNPVTSADSYLLDSWTPISALFVCLSAISKAFSRPGDLPVIAFNQL